ncbi:MAG: hypothetical protein M3Y83_01815 [Actinomycetota bacterium]|nr:hypothetical protein [Actinomycetota bacterium]
MQFVEPGFAFRTEMGLGDAFEFNSAALDLALEAAGGFRDRQEVIVAVDEAVGSRLEVVSGHGDPSGCVLVVI